MFCLSFAYKFGNNLVEDYYINRHTPMVQEVLASVTFNRFEARKDIASNTGATGSYQLIASIYFDSMDNLQRFLKHPMVPQLQNDIKNFYSGDPDILIEEVVVDLLSQK
jgi:uncharacterized protein (TIGR02118 family)